MAGSIVGRKTYHKSRGITRLNVAITVDASGDATISDIGAAFGRLVGILYAPGSSGLDTGADITLKDKVSGATIFTLTDGGTSGLLIHPQILAAAQTKTAQTPAAGLVVNTDIYLAGELQLVVAQGGVSKSGSIAFIIDEG